MKAIETILIGVTVATLGCARQQQSTPLAGDYPRASVKLMQNSREVPVPTDGPIAAALPTSITLDNANHFAAASENGAMSGTVLLERDSIFFVQHAKGQQRVVLAGRAADDAIDVHWHPALSDEPIPDGTDVELRFVRNKASGRRGRFPH